MSVYFAIKTACMITLTIVVVYRIIVWLRGRDPDGGVPCPLETPNKLTAAMSYNLHEKYGTRKVA